MAQNIKHDNWSPKYILNFSIITSTYILKLCLMLLFAYCSNLPQLLLPLTSIHYWYIAADKEESEKEPQKL